MKAMILAAGRGERMRPLTDRVPKAMLEAGGRPLIVHLIERLARAGFVDLVINVSHLAEAIERGLGDGARARRAHRLFARSDARSRRRGGIAYALPLLGRCAVRRGRTATSTATSISAGCAPPRSGSPAAALRGAPRAGGQSRRTILPAISAWSDGTVTADGRAARLTFSGIGVYSPALFAEVARGRALPARRAAQAGHRARTR